jgi:hypothetical protein
VTGSGDSDAVRASARAFIADAFDALAGEHVIPTPVFHPYIAVGRDYFGDTIRALPHYQALEAELEQAYPNRLAEPLKRRHGEFASTYMFSLLEACVARCGLCGNFDPHGAAIEESLDEMLYVLGADTYEMVCIRHVAHLTTTGGEEIRIGDITVVPEPEHWGALTDRVQDEIAGAAQAWNRDDPRPFAPPHSLLIAREVTDDPDIEAVMGRLSGRLDRFLMLARLLTAGTTRTNYELIGPATRVARLKPQLTVSRGGLLDTPIRRTVRLAGDQVPAFAMLGSAIDVADIKREGMVAISFDVALGRFNRSHSSDSQYEHLVDLATALEAALIGPGDPTEGLTLRLRTRAAALLATANDPATALFDDVGQLYSLRSKLVHGGPIKERDLHKTIRRISTIPTDGAGGGPWVTLGHAVDRMRDLVRRAILARLCLSAEPDPLWPLDRDAHVDSALADDAQRAKWRERWHERLAALGAQSAAERPRAAVDFLSQDDR